MGGPKMLERRGSNSPAITLYGIFKLKCVCVCVFRAVEEEAFPVDRVHF